MRVAELTEVLLDYWTAVADGRTAKILRAGERLNGVRLENDVCAALTPGYDDWWQPHHVTCFTMESIIEREKIATSWAPFAGWWYGCIVGSTVLERKHSMPGETHLIAAARAFIASRFGDTVPDEPRAG